MINFTSKGLNANLWLKTLDKVKGRQLGKLSRAAKLCAEATLELATIYCPIDKTPQAPHPGLLRSSGKIRKVGPYEYQVSFGGNGSGQYTEQVAWYAARVHEIEKFHHEYPTRYEYLKEAINHLHAGFSDVEGVTFPSYARIFEMVYAGNKITGLITVEDTSFDFGANTEIPD